MERKNSSVVCGLVLLLPVCGFAQQAGTTTETDKSNIEMVVVTGVRASETLYLDSSKVTQPGLDNSDLLRQFPGGNRNVNGPVTRISQYRGMFGAQNNVSIDGLGYIAGGPNWMDSPLSSIPQSLTQSVTLYRGLGSVADIQEGLGGSVAIESRKGDFSQRDGWSNFGLIEAGYGTNASSWGGALYTGIQNSSNWLDIAISVEQGDDYEYPAGTVAATQYERDQYRLGYGHRFESTDLTLGAVINRTGLSGTPALPMDIRYVDSEQYSLGTESALVNGELSFAVNVLSVEHLMDNFTLRPPPAGMNGMPMVRQNLATGDSGGYKLAYNMAVGDGDVQLGIDGRWEDHDALITNPMNDMFYITNFNAVERDRIGLFVQSVWSVGEWDLEAGLRYNHVKMNAGDVGGNMAMMPMMGDMMAGEMMPGEMSMSMQEMLDMLAMQFNNADRSQSENQWSGIFKASHQLGQDLRLNLGVGRKMRSPSYQERYLWLPMEATAGLADGYTYIGDINLQAEKSVEFTVGLDWSIGEFTVTPEAHYRDVNDYIQGVPSTNQLASMFAMMMSGKAPLQYANVDAELYGLDLGYEWEMSSEWAFRGNLGYVRGKRTDVEDNLYRIAPLSSFVALTFSDDNYFVSAESLSASKQDKVSSYNTESPSAGWGIVNLRGGYNFGDAFAISLGVENIFDKAYQDHLAGYNRVAGSDIPLQTRIYGIGRNYYLRLNANW